MQKSAKVHKFVFHRFVCILLTSLQDGSVSSKKCVLSCYSQNKQEKLTNMTTKFRNVMNLGNLGSCCDLTNNKPTEMSAIFTTLMNRQICKCLWHLWYGIMWIDRNGQIQETYVYWQTNEIEIDRQRYVALQMTQMWWYEEITFHRIANICV